MTRAGHAAANAVLHGIFCLGRRIEQQFSAVELLEEAPSRHALVFIGEPKRGGGVAAAVTNPLRNEEARR